MSLTERRPDVPTCPTLLCSVGLEAGGVKNPPLPPRPHLDLPPPPSQYPASLPPEKCFPAPKNFTFCTDRFTTQNFTFLHRTAKVLRLSERMSALRHTLQLFAPRAPCCHCATVQISLCSDILWAPKFFWNCPVLIVSQYGKTFIIRTQSKLSGTVDTPSRSNRRFQCSLTRAGRGSGIPLPVSHPAACRQRGPCGHEGRGLCRYILCVRASGTASARARPRPLRF